MTTDDPWARTLDPLDPHPHDDGGRPADADVIAELAGVLGERPTWEGGPSPEVRSRLLAAVTAQAPDGAPGAAGSGTVVDLTARRRRRWPVAVGGFAAGIAAAGATVLALNLPGSGGDVQTVALAATPEAPEAAVSADVEPLSAGVAITLHITGLPPAPDGEYYAAWVEGERGVVGVGSFHWREGGIPIELWSGVVTEAYPDFYVTLESEDGPPGPDGPRVIEGRID